MKTTINERITRIVLGLALVACGYVFIMPLQLTAFYTGLMIVGFGIDPRGTEFPEDEIREPSPKESSMKVSSSRQQLSSEPSLGSSTKTTKKASRKKKLQAN